MAEISVTSDALRKVRSALGAFKEGIGDFGIQAAQQRATCEEEYCAVIRNVEGTVRMIESKCDQLCMEIRQVENDIADANEQRKALFDSINRMESRRQELEDQKSALMAMCADQQSQPDSAEIKAQIEAQIDMINEQIIDVKADIQDKEKARDQLGERMFDMDRDLHNKENELSAERLRLNKCKEKLYQLQAEERRVQNDFDDYVTKAKRLVSDLSGSADVKCSVLDQCINLVEEMENWSV